MPRGGARASSGPPPDPNALRRDRKSDAAEWLILPVAGREGDPPEWPLDPEANGRESRLWSLLWSKPQAVAWQANGVELEVALYVRRLSEAERPGSPTNLSTLVRQLSDSLGLSTVGLRSNRWKIESEQSSSSEPKRQRRASSSSRERLKVIEGGESA